ncbi:uncharacterized protein LOC143851789 [Tasmannia lanceolata]|uniref:uncharacterized protein LOC143851789 n=1 Tax=Tasmannia lanceolata TaxID=3420 RepID=UPI004062F434
MALSLPRLSSEINNKVGNFMSDSIKMENNPKIRDNTDDKKEGPSIFPMRVYCVSFMSKQHRLEIANLLKTELQQVRSLLQDLNNKNPHQKPKKRKSDPMNSTPHHEITHTKKLKPNSDEKRDLTPKGLHTLSMKLCGNLLDRFMSHDYAWVFNSPVNVVELKLHDYFDIIKNPMDLGTIKQKLESGAYCSDPLSFAFDVRLTFANAMTYNLPGDEIYLMAETLSNFFELGWKIVQKRLMGQLDRCDSIKSDNSTKEKPSSPVFRKNESLPPLPLKPKCINIKRTVAETPSDYHGCREYNVGLSKIRSYKTKVVKKEEFRRGSQNIRPAVPTNMPNLVTAKRVEGKYKSSSRSSQDSNSQSSELDMICSLGKKSDRATPVSAKKVAENKFCMHSITYKKPSRIFEVDSKKRFPNDSVEDKCHSASRSGVTNNHYDGTNALMHRLSPTIHNHAASSRNRSVDTITKSGQETLKHDIACDIEKRSCKLMEFEQRQREGMAQLIEKAKLAKPSPRNRSADTITKAEEKTLKHDRACDMEKRSCKPREFEQPQREGMAQLIEQAKLAKNRQQLVKPKCLIEANQKKELDTNATCLAQQKIQKTTSMSATIEIKPKRQLEREAARLALQKMEDTVSIYDDCQFLEDLKMLGLAQYAPIHNSSARCFISPEDLGLFKPSERNQLEQLGLCMNMEADDGYEGDREEGEIY